MKPVRRIATLFAATATLGLVLSSAPAQADFTWGYVAPVKPAKVNK